MKKTIFTLAIVFGMVFNAMAQQWTELFSNENILVEKAVVECNPNNNLYPFSYLILRYSNRTDEKIEFIFEFEKWFNGVKEIHSVNEDIKNHTMKIVLGPHEKNEGTCDMNSEKYRMFYKTSHPKLDNKLTDIKIIEITK